MALEIKAPVAIIGPSGTGKSSAIESLPVKRTLVINTENKPLPFESYMDFKVVNATTYKKLQAVLNQCAAEEIEVNDGNGGKKKVPGGASKYDYIVVDSFTAIVEFIEKYTDHQFSGYDQWKQYNIILRDIVGKLKNLPQQVFLIALPEQKEIGFGDVKEYIRVKGKELKYGWVEEQFAFVLFTNPVYDEETREMCDVELMFRPNELNSAKAPRGVFTERPKNDMMEIYKKIEAYYGKGNTSTTS